jgi:hypothetical protein
MTLAMSLCLKIFSETAVRVLAVKHVWLRCRISWAPAFCIKIPYQRFRLVAIIMGLCSVRAAPGTLNIQHSYVYRLHN